MQKGGGKAGLIQGGTARRDVCERLVADGTLEKELTRQSLQEGFLLQNSNKETHKLY